MFGPGLTTVFASRWKALWWGACILATAYCSVPAANDGNGGQIDAATQEQAQQALKALEAMRRDRPVSDGQGKGNNPWSVVDR